MENVRGGNGWLLRTAFGMTNVSRKDFFMSTVRIFNIIVYHGIKGDIMEVAFDTLVVLKHWRRAI